MRRLLPFAALTITACASTPPKVTYTPIARPAVSEVRSGLSGLTQSALVGRFGQPAFEVREGSGLKLQWQNGACVLDAYLYPPATGAGAASVLHVDTRRPGSGEAVPVEGCITALSAR